MIAAAQAPRPVFEAASVKPNTSGPGLVRVMTPPGRFSVVNAPLRMVLRNAYALPDYRMSGGPGWLDTDRWDIEATAGGAATFDEIRAMTRTLLEDRFKLKAHTETRELPIYVLSMVRRDGRLGDQIKASGAECLPITAPPGAPPPPPPPPGPAPTRAQCGSLLGMGAIGGRKLRIQRLAEVLEPYVGRHIVDQTNLPGEFDLDLRWLPDQPPGRGGPPLLSDDNAPSLFTALQEQLGLKLESQRGPVEMLVIDEVSKPSAD
jgi:uncharacterized protein (TIGR03435 family)